jgi:hypothetical protein
LAVAFFWKGNVYEKDYLIPAHFSYGTSDRRLLKQRRGVEQRLFPGKIIK